jgi:uncharacterized protein (DUF433 family)
VNALYRRISATIQRVRGTAERNAQIAERARAGHTPTALAAEYGITRQRVDQIIRRTHARAREAVGRAICLGVLVRPSACAQCHRPCKPEAHHRDYSRPLDVVWLCRPCHVAAHTTA